MLKPFYDVHGAVGINITEVAHNEGRWLDGEVGAFILRDGLFMYMCWAHMYICI